MGGLCRWLVWVVSMGLGGVKAAFLLGLNRGFLRGLFWDICMTAPSIIFLISISM